MTWVDVDEDESDFEKIGADFERPTQASSIGPVGNATARLMPHPDWSISPPSGWRSAGSPRTA